MKNSAGLAWLVAFGVLLMSMKKKPQSAAVDATREEQLLSTLLEPFRVKAVAMLAELRLQGFDPFVGNTARTPEQAKKNAETCTVNAKGETDCLGIEGSMHVLDAALDVRSRTGRKDFYPALGRAAERQGLTWGGRWAGVNYDPGHVQALPVMAQKAFRAMSVPERLAYLTRLPGKTARA